MIKTVIFDIDGTLVDHNTAIKNASRNFYNKFFRNKTRSLSEFQEIWQQEHDKYIEQYMTNKISFEEQRVLRVMGVFSKIGENITREEAEEYFGYYLKAYEDNWKLFSDVSLEDFEDYKLAIISDGDSRQQRQKLRNNNIYNYFDSIVISGDLDVSKPDRDIFEESLQQLNVNATEAIYIGDNYNKDFMGAIEVGLYSCLIDRTADKEIQKHNKRGYIINSLKMVSDIIKNIK